MLYEVITHPELELDLLRGVELRARAGLFLRVRGASREQHAADRESEGEGENAIQCFHEIPP